MKQPSMDTVSLTVQEFAKMDLPGDIFSSPVMIGGRVYVGCRDDYVHCLKLEANIECNVSQSLDL